ncbi:MAG: hypothetical protein WD768_08290 [Phycisphaeraceae bacterium]
MSLEQELKTYDAHHAEAMAAHPEDWMLVSEDEVLGYYPTYAEAIAAGYEKVGIKRRFMVKKVKEEPIVFLRPINPCRI